MKAVGVGSRPRWNGDELQILTTNYGKVPASFLKAMLPGRPLHSIHQKASRLRLAGNKGLSIRKYHKLNQCFFSNVGVVNSYWAGFIAADGCVHGGKMLQLFQSDPSVIKRFCKTLGYDGPIRKRISVLSNRPNYSVSIYSQRIVRDLFNNYNIVPNKSHVLTSPTITENSHKLAFITGLIDGDGSIVNYNNNLSVNILGTKQVLQWCVEALNVSATVREKPLSDNNNIKSVKPIYSTTYSGKKAYIVARRLMLVEELSGIRLRRKWGMFEY